MKIALVLFALLVLPQMAAAQETQDTFHLEQMVVSATRLAQPLATVPAAVSVVTSADFVRLGLRNVSDVLRTVSGTALVQGGSFGALTSLFMRGGESDYVQVLLDGVQINSPGELFDYSALALDNIERVEIVKGPVSVLYGSDAVAGVVHLFSKQGGGRVRSQLTALGGRGDKVGGSAEGSFKSLDIRGDLNGGSPDLQYSIGFSHFGTEGALAYNNDHRLTSGSARIAAAPGERFDAALSTRLTRNRFHYPTDGSGNLVDANQFHEADAIAIGVDAGFAVTARTELRSQLSWSRNRDHIDDEPDSPADTIGFYRFLSDENFRRRSLDIRLNQRASGHSVLTVGVELEQQFREGSSVSGSSFGDFEVDANNERNNRAAYAQLITNAGRLNVQGGLRLDRNEPFGDFVTYRAGASLQLASQWRVRGSFGTAFKEPRFFEQFSQGFGAQGNPELEPEKSTALELGVDVGSRAWSLGLTAFKQTFEDLIQYTFAPVNDVNYVNVGAVSADGIELETRWADGPWSVRAAFTLLDTKVDDAGDGNDPLYEQGERLIRRPDRTASVAAHFGASYQLGVVLSYVSERTDLFYDETFTAHRVRLPAYAKFDLNARTPALRGLRGVLKLENLFDREYQEIRGFPARGRVVFIGASLDR